MHIEKIYDKLSHKIKEIGIGYLFLLIFTSWGLFKHTNNLVIDNSNLK